MAAAGVSIDLLLRKRHCSRLLDGDLRQVEPEYSVNRSLDSHEEIAARLAAFKASGDPNKLWPHVSREKRMKAQREILALAQELLAPRGSQGLLTSTSGDETRALSVAAHILGVGPLIGYWMERDRIKTVPEVRAIFAVHLDHGRRRAMFMRQRFLEILDALNQRGVVPTVLKGIYIGETYLPELGTKPFADIDLLLDSAMQPAAREALREIGLEEIDLSYGESTWRPRGDNLQVRSLEFEHAENPWSVDFHAYLDQRYFWGKWSRFGERPRTETQPWIYEGCRATVFTQPLLTSHLAQHAVCDFRAVRLIRIVELVRVLRRDVQSGEQTWDALSSYLADTGAGRFAFPAFELCARLAPDAVDRDFVAELSTLATPRLRRVIDRWWENGVGLDSAPTWDERLMWSETPFELVRNACHQLVRRSMVVLSPVSVPRLRYNLRRMTGIAPRTALPKTSVGPDHRRK